MTSKWEVGKLSDVADWRSGGTPRSGASEYYTKGIHPWAVIKDVQNQDLWKTNSLITDKALPFAKGLAPVGSVLVTMYGSIGRSAVARVPVATNQAILWGVPKDGYLSEFIALWIQSNESTLDAMGRGATQRNINGSMVKEFPIPLMPLAEQRRIVDLIGALDDAIEAAEQYRSSLESLHSEALLKELENIQGPEMPLSSVFDYMIGGAWGSPPGKDDTETLALGPSSFAAGRTAVEGQLGTVRTLNNKRANARFLHEGDIILERSGGSPAQPVGRVLRMESGPNNIVPSDFMRLLRVDKTSADHAYVFWVLWSKYKSGESLQFQKFTTGIRNLNITDYLNGTSIKLPSLDKQREIAGIAESLLQTSAEAKTHMSSLRALRSELLTALLSGAHEIPESYDEVMNAV